MHPRAFPPVVLSFKNVSGDRPGLAVQGSYKNIWFVLSIKISERAWPPMDNYKQVDTVRFNHHLGTQNLKISVCTYLTCPDIF